MGERSTTSIMTRDEGRAFARENCARELYEHKKTTGDTKTSYEDCKREIDRMADKADAKRDR